SATDGDSDPLTYWATGLPDGATFDTATRTFAWTPTEGQDGSYTVTFSAGDGLAIDSESITLSVNEVNQVPVLAPIGDQSVVENSQLSFTISATDSDLVGGAPNTLTYSAAGLPQGAAFDPATATFTWTPLPGQRGTHNVTFSASDGIVSDSEIVTITVKPFLTFTTLSFQDGVFPDASYAGTGDTRIYALNAGTNYGSSSFIRVDGAPSVIDGLLRWDLSAIPAGSAVESVRMSLDILDATSGSYDVYALKRNWVEGEATWIHASAGNAWEIPGAMGASDRGTAVLGVVTASALGPAVVELNEQGVALVQSWIIDPASNHGLVIHREGVSKDFEFSSREAVTPASRPKLEVTIASNVPNEAPVLAPIGNKSTTEGGALSFAVSATDGDSSVLTYWATGLPAGAVFDAAARTFTWTPAENQDGSHTLTFGVHDGLAIDSETITVTVGEVNQAPVLASIGGRSGIEGSQLSFAISATDDDLVNGAPNILTYSATGLPEGATFDTGTGTFTWTPSASQVGAHTVTFGVGDGAATDSETIMITVERAAATATYKFQDGVFPFEIYAGTRDTRILSEKPDNNYGISDSLWLDGAPYETGSLLRWDLSRIPAGAVVSSVAMTIDVLNASSDTYEIFALKRAWAENEATWNLASASTPWEIAGAKGAGDRSAVVLGAVAVSSLGPAVIAWNAEGEALVQSWIDNPATNYGIIIDRAAVSDAVEFSSREAVALASRPKLEVTVEADAANQAPVLAPIGDKPVAEGGALSFAVSATDGDSSGLTYWATGLPAGAAFDTSTRTFTWTPAEDQDGPHTLTFAVSDGLATDSETITVTVNEVNQAPVLAPIGDRSTAEAALLSFAVSATDADLVNGAPNTLVYSATDLPEGAAFDSGAGTFTWTPAAGQAGDYSVTFSVGDGAATVSETITITVAPTVGVVAYRFQDGVFPLGTYAGTRDTRINAERPDNNYGLSDFVRVDGAPFVVDALLRWDLTAIPAGSPVHSVAMTLDILDQSPGTYEIYALKRDWVEGEATWNNASAGNPWAVAGASGASDRGTAVLGLVTAASLGPAVIEWTAAGKAQVQSWINDPASNFGIVIHKEGVSKDFEFSSREGVAPASRPMLEVRLPSAELGEAPVLTAVEPLAGANEDEAFTIDYSTMAAAADESDPDGDPVSFLIESVAGGGNLMKGDAPVVPGITLLSSGESLVWTGQPDANGLLDAFTVRAWDGLFVSDTPVPVRIGVSAVNDAPSFTKGANQVVVEDAGPQTVVAWATSISAGAANESSQTLAFETTTDNDALFAVKPAIDPATGNLTYTPLPDAFGEAVVTVVLKDDGGGSDASAPQTFTIVVNAVNEAPSFVKGRDQVHTEDAGAQTAAAWARSISAGPANEAGQTLTFQITTSNDALFAVKPAIDPATGHLTYTLAANAFGEAIVTVRLKDDGGTDNGGADTSGPQSFAIAVGAVNDVPSFVKGADQVVAEDAGIQSVAAWATSISAGAPNEAHQTIAFEVTTDNDALFAAGPSIDPATGELTYTPLADAFGEAVVTVVLKDDGGTAGGGADASAPQTFTITVLSVNDAPSFVKGPDQTLDRNYEPQTVAGWASGMSAGPADEAAQTLTFEVTTDNDALFAVLPSIDVATGDLTYTPAADVSGVAIVTVALKDSGGTDNGGDDSDEQTFTIRLLGRNEAPSFVKGPDQAVSEDAGAQTVNGWATSISAGPANEAAQTLTFEVTTDNDALFAVLPSIDASTGDLTYTPAADAFGEAAVTVVLKDNGGTDNGGDDTSDEQTFTISVLSVNDAPSLTLGPDPVVDEDAGAQSVAGWATQISAGPANEAGQAITMSITTDNDALFAELPSIDLATGTLTYAPVPDAFGVAVVTVRLEDDGGTENGGSASADLAFTITVNPVNEAPSFTKGADQTVDEDAGDQVVEAWAASISAGPANEAGQVLTFEITTDNDVLFAARPAVDPSTGALTYTPASHAFGTAVVTVVLKDNGGTDNGGDDTSDEQTFTITILPVDDLPVADPGGPYHALFAQDLLLDGAASYDPDNPAGGTIVNYRWDLGDDGVWDYSGVQPTVPWADLVRLPYGQTLSVRLEVTDVSGATHSATADLTVAAPVVLGPVDSLLFSSQDLAAGAVWYRLEATHNGWLTVEALREDVEIALLDQSFLPLQTSLPVDGGQRLDETALVGATFYFRLSGASGIADLRITNLVGHVGTAVTVHGTARDDQFAFDGSGEYALAINGAGYAFAAGQAATFAFDGLGGSDHVQFIGTDGPDNATLYPASGTFSGQGYSMTVANIESSDYDGGGGEDTVWVWGSSDGNTYTARPGSAEMTGGSVSISAKADRIYGRGGGGADTATIWDSPGDDLFEFFPIWARATGEGYFHHLQGFTLMIGKAELGVNGTDTAILRGSPQGDLFRSTTTTTRMLTIGAWRNAEGFDTIAAYARGGKDKADTLVIQDTPGADTFKLKPLETVLVAPTYKVTAYGFGNVEANRVNVNSAADLMSLEGSAGDDTMIGNPAWVRISSANPAYSNKAAGFPSVMAYSTGEGLDKAFFSDFDGEADTRIQNDTFTANSLVGELAGPGYRLWARLFDEVHADVKLGRDIANLSGTTEADELNGTAAEVSLAGPNAKGTFANYAKNFDEVNAFATAGQDKAVLTDAAVDLLTYGPPAGIPIEELAQALWLNQFEKIELWTSGTGEKTDVDNVARVFAFWD
ncbi:MAG: tandem-95 repeat protein, partial [Pirellulales bacterium]|nr:tandem-95 repeat protein [Pirellulales bacterium]